VQYLESNTVLEGKTLKSDKSIQFPEGLPAFEDVRDYVLISNEEEHPFLWLQAVKTPNLAFVMVDPFMLLSDYQPDICEDDVRFLKINKPEDCIVLSIVNVHNSDGKGITTNLVGPIIINAKEQIGKQIILQNHLSYSVRFPITDL
jgi:flagellar assembly factor FliW